MTPTPTGRVEPTDRGRDLVLERLLPGSTEDAWASLTESDRLARWFCRWTGEARVGGRVRLTLIAEEGEPTAEAEILACEPPRHLAVRTVDSAGVWVLEATLEPAGPEQTRLRFVHHLSDGTPAAETGAGWEYYLDRLLTAMTDQPAPEFDDYWPSMQTWYADQDR